MAKYVVCHTVYRAEYLERVVEAENEQEAIGIVVKYADERWPDYQPGDLIPDDDWKVFAAPDNMETSNLQNG